MDALDSEDPENQLSLINRGPAASRSGGGVGAGGEAHRHGSGPSALPMLQHPGLGKASAGDRLGGQPPSTSYHSPVGGGRNARAPLSEDATIVKRAAVRFKRLVRAGAEQEGGEEGAAKGGRPGLAAARVLSGYLGTLANAVVEAEEFKRVRSQPVSCCSSQGEC